MNNWFIIFLQKICCCRQPEFEYENEIYMDRNNNVMEMTELEISRNPNVKLLTPIIIRDL